MPRTRPPPSTNNLFRNNSLPVRRTYPAGYYICRPGKGVDDHGRVGAGVCSKMKSVDDGVLCRKRLHAPKGRLTTAAVWNVPGPFGRKKSGCPALSEKGGWRNVMACGEGETGHVTVG